VLGEVVTQSVKPDQSLENGWPKLCMLELVNMGFGSGGLMRGSAIEFKMNCAISKTFSCPPMVAPATSDTKGKVSAPVEKMSYAIGRERESFKKTKADKVQQNTNVGGCMCVCFINYSILRPSYY